MKGGNGVLPLDHISYLLCAHLSLPHLVPCSFDTNTWILLTPSDSPSVWITSGFASSSAIIGLVFPAFISSLWHTVFPASFHFLYHPSISICWIIYIFLPVCLYISPSLRSGLTNAREIHEKERAPLTLTHCLNAVVPTPEPTHIPSFPRPLRRVLLDFLAFWERSWERKQCQILEGSREDGLLVKPFAGCGWATHVCWGPWGYPDDSEMERSQLWPLKLFGKSDEWRIKLKTLKATFDWWLQTGLGLGQGISPC